MGCLPQFPLCLDVTDTYTCVIARMNCGIRSCRGPYIILHNDCPQLKKQTSIFEDCSYYLTTESVQYVYVLGKFDSEFLQLVWLWLASVAIPVPGGLATALSSR